MRNIFFILLIPFFSFGQIDTCNVCNIVNLSSTYNPTLTHTWVCSDGQATNEVNPTLTVTDDMLCILTVSNEDCLIRDSIYIRNCDCDIEAELAYSNDTLRVTVDAECISDPEADPYFEWHFWNGSGWVYVDGSVQGYIVIEDPGLYRVTVECDDCTVQKTYEVDCVGTALEITNFSNSFDGINNFGGDYLIFEIAGCTSPLLAILQKKVGGSWIALDTFTNVTSYFWTGFGGGEYRLIAQGCGCTDMKTFNLNLPCSVTINVTNNGDILTANYTANSCPNPTISWYCVLVSGCASGTYLGSGTTFDTDGIDGTYQAYIDCGGGCINAANFTFSSCPLNIVSVLPNILAPPFGVTVNTIGCPPINVKTYEIYKETFVSSGVWNLILTTTNVNSSVNIDLGSYGSFRIDVTGCDCTRSYFYNNIVDCGTYTVGVTGWGNPCVETSETYYATWSGGGGITSVLWFVNGVSTGITTTTYTHSFLTAGTYLIRADFTTTAGCTGTFTRTVIVVDCGPPPCELDIEIDQGSLLLCSGVTQLYTTTITGATSPINYTWSYIVGGVIYSAGSGPTNNITFQSNGVYQIVVTAVDANGCTDTDILFNTVDYCLLCDCFPTVTIEGCQLIIANFGGGCSDYGYVLEGSINGGVTWVTISSGTEIIDPITYTPSINGLYRVRINKSDCPEQISNIINVTCVIVPCVNPPTVTLSGYTGLSCELAPIFVNGNFIGGSATNVTLTHNGSGSHNITWFTATTFRITYYPVSADIGSTVTIRLITNNPLGFPCVPQEVLFSAVVSDFLEPVITSSGSAMCANSIRMLTAEPFGGVWSIVSGPGILVGNQLTATGAGTIIVGYTIGSSGCFTGESMSISVTNCTTTFTQSSCVITATFVGCSGYNYQLQYSETGTGWTTKQSGPVSNFTYNPIQNGFYRLIAVKDGCLTVIKELEITCVPCNSDFSYSPMHNITDTEYIGGFFSIDNTNPLEFNLSGCLDGKGLSIINTPPLGDPNYCYSEIVINSTYPVTWEFTHLIPEKATNLQLVSQTPYQLTLRSARPLWNISADCTGAVLGIIPTTVCGFTQNFNYFAKVKATDACGNEYVRYPFKFGNN